VVLREYATTTTMAPLYRDKETFVLRQLASAGLPTPAVLATTSIGSLASLLADHGGDPLELLRGTADPSAIWAEVGTMLRKLHEVDVSYAGYMASPDWYRPWMRFIPYFLKALRPIPTQQPEIAPAVDELRRLLRGPVAERLDSKPRSICCGPYSMPGLMIERAGRRWQTVSWLGLGYYVSVGDPDRDVVAITSRQEADSGMPVPASFWSSYGRRPDAVSAIVYEVFHSRRLADRVPETVDRLRDAL
jgi:hypothetical protein